MRLYTSRGAGLTGPWSAETLYTLPPLPANATVAYAAKSHPWMLPRAARRNASAACELLISYNTNGDLPKMRWTTDVYHPIFVRLSRSSSS